MKTIPIKTISLKPKPLKPLSTTFTIPKHKTNIKQKAKPRTTINLWEPRYFPPHMAKLSYPEAKAKYGLAPFGDADKDGILNIYDCRPFDPDKHRITPEEEKIKVFSWKSGWQTGKDIQDHFISLYPKIFEEDTPGEKKLTGYLGSSLRHRRAFAEKMGFDAPPPFKELVGEHTVFVQFDQTETNIVHAILLEYLHRHTTGIGYRIIPDKPTELEAIDFSLHVARTKAQNELKRDPAYRTNYENLAPEQRAVVDKRAKEIAAKGVSLKTTFAKELEKVNAPSHVTELLTVLNPDRQKVTFLITDDPRDVILQSTQIRAKKRKEMTYEDLQRAPGLYSISGLAFSSCHTFGKAHEKGVFGDVHYMHAVAYIYLGGKKPGKDLPSGRLTLRWGRQRADENTLDVAIECHAYPWSKVGAGDEQTRNILMSQALKQGLHEIIKSHGLALGDVVVPKHHIEGYPDTWMDIRGAQDISGKVLYRPETYKLKEPLQDLASIGSPRKLIEQYTKREKETFPRPLWKYFAGDTSPLIRSRMVQVDHDVKTEDLLPLALDISPSVVVSLAARPKLLEEHPEVYRAIAHRPDIEPATKAPLVLGARPPEDVWGPLFKYRTLGLKALEQPYADLPLRKHLISVDPEDHPFREAIARLPKLTQAEVIRLLSKDQPEDVRRATLRNHYHVIPRTRLISIAKGKNPHDHPLLDELMSLTMSNRKDLVYPIYKALPSDMRESFFFNNEAIFTPEQQSEILLKPDTPSNIRLKIFDHKTSFTLDELSYLSHTFTTDHPVSHDNWKVILHHLENHLFKVSKPSSATKIKKILQAAIQFTVVDRSLPMVKKLRETPIFDDLIWTLRDRIADCPPEHKHLLTRAVHTSGILDIAKADAKPATYKALMEVMKTEEPVLKPLDTSTFTIGETATVKRKSPDWIGWTPGLTDRVGQRGTITSILPEKGAIGLRFSDDRKHFFPLHSFKESATPSITFSQENVQVGDTIEIKTLTEDEIEKLQTEFHLREETIRQLPGERAIVKVTDPRWFDGEFLEGRWTLPYWIISSIVTRTVDEIPTQYNIGDKVRVIEVRDSVYTTSRFGGLVGRIDGFGYRSTPDEEGFLTQLGIHFPDEEEGYRTFDRVKVALVERAHSREATEDFADTVTMIISQDDDSERVMDYLRTVNIQTLPHSTIRAAFDDIITVFESGALDVAKYLEEIADEGLTISEYYVRLLEHNMTYDLANHYSGDLYYNRIVDRYGEENTLTLLTAAAQYFRDFGYIDKLLAMVEDTDFPEHVRDHIRDNVPPPED